MARVYHRNTTETPKRRRGSPGRRWTRGFTLVGHRGAAGLVAENTLPSFQKAAALGANAVELDVYAVDSELLVIHDDTLRRTTNGRGRVMGSSLDKLRALDAGMDTAKGAQIPLLSEVLATLPSNVAVNIELKGPQTAEPVVRALAALQPRQQILVSSFEHKQLARFRELDQQTAVAPLFHTSKRGMLDIAASLDACAINLNVKIASKARLQQIRSAGFGALIYTVNNLRSARRLARDGATGVFTDFPDRITKNSVLDA